MVLTSATSWPPDREKGAAIHFLSFFVRLFSQDRSWHELYVILMFLSRGRIFFFFLTFSAYIGYERMVSFWLEEIRTSFAYSSCAVLFLHDNISYRNFLQFD